VVSIISMSSESWQLLFSFFLWQLQLKQSK
jgi:hypothetical protein